MTLSWDQSFFLRKFLPKVKLYDNSTTPARSPMHSSRLTVINYISTSYLEALIADIPTIILWNQDAYFLEDKYKGFFDDLVEVQVVHTDPVEEAHFVEQVKDNPEKWWHSSKVQHARREFLKDNIGSPEVLVNHLIDRVNSFHST